MHDQPGAEQLGTIPTPQLATIAGGVASPGYRMPYPIGAMPYPGGSCGWPLPGQPVSHAPGHPPAPHAPIQPKPPVTGCYPPASPRLPYLPMRPGAYGYGFNPWGFGCA